MATTDTRDVDKSIDQVMAERVCTYTCVCVL